MNFAEKENLLEFYSNRMCLAFDAIYMFVQSLFFKIWLYIYKMDGYNIFLFIFRLLILSLS